jgi:Ca2+-binding RTX toxin-like protein
LLDVSQFFSDLSLSDADVSIPLDWNETAYRYYDDTGALTYEVVVLEHGDTTFYSVYDASMTLMGSISETVQGDTVNLYFYDAAGDLITRERTITRDDYTQVEYWDADGRTSAVKYIHTDTQTGVQYYDADWNLTGAYLETDDGNGRTQIAEYGPNWEVIYRETTTISGNVTTTVIEENGEGNITGGTKVTEKPDFTLTETYGQDFVLTGAVKEIHTATQTGEQVYDADYNLISAHLETDDGNGRTQVADYGPDWEVIYRKTTTVSGNVTTTVIEENGEGNITGGTKVTETADFTLTETYGQDFVLTGAVKEIHTATQTGEQVYDADYNLISAHLETDDGNGRTQVADYGPDWEVIYRKTTTISGNVTTTVIEENGDGNITGGSKVTEKPDFTLTETYGPGWTLTGAVKEIHTATTTGTQVYDGNYNLLSASLVIIDGNRHVTEEYGPGWTLIERTRVTTTDDKVVTEYLTGENADLQWRTVIYGDGAEDENRYEVYQGDGYFVGNDAMDEMLGDDGDDTFFGMAGDDTLKGGQGDDTLNGGDDDDYIDGGKGEDDIAGESGNDTIKAGNGADSVSGGDGDDWIDGGRDNDTLKGGDDNDTLKGSSGDDLLEGGDGNDELNGGGDNDALFGEAGDDELYGNSGDDTLEGGTGADRLYGSNGSDVLIGIGDGDLLNGGEDADVFVFKDIGEFDGTGDTIADFTKGEDQINVADLGVDIFSDTFTAGVANQLVVSVVDGDSILSFDVEGDGIVDYSFTVRGVTDLDVDDFDFTTDPLLL